MLLHVSLIYVDLSVQLHIHAVLASLWLNASSRLLAHPQLYAPAEDAAQIVMHAAFVPWTVDAEPGMLC
jgi:hypothetical protein